MKIDGNMQVPNMVVYVALYVVVFGVSIWLLIADKDSSTNGFLYAAMILSVVAGLAKFALHLYRRPPRSISN